MFAPLPIAASPDSLSEEDFQFFRERIRHIAGISLSPAKQDLVRARLRERVGALALSSHAEYRAHLEALNKDDPEWQRFINCLTTNKTDWFREPAHFRMLEESFLPRWLSTGKDCLHVWCAASSTGEEPYTLSLVLDRFLRPRGKEYRILATDIDTNVLALAQNGVYSRQRVEEQVPPEFHDRFIRGKRELSDWMKVKPIIKAPLSFENVNLSQGLRGERPEFDLIFLRNVLIYFDAAGVQNVVEKTFPLAAPNSLLVIAHSESLQNISTRWSYVKPSLYRKGGFYG
jgi:chemotaxis protein methyltransferase CheR